MKALEITNSKNLNGTPVREIEECPLSHRRLANLSTCIDCPYCKGFDFEKSIRYKDPANLYRTDHTHVWCDHPDFKEKKKVFKICAWSDSNASYIVGEFNSNSMFIQIYPLSQKNSYAHGIDFCPKCGKDHKGHLVEEKK